MSGPGTLYRLELTISHPDTILFFVLFYSAEFVNFQLHSILTSTKLANKLFQSIQASGNPLLFSFLVYSTNCYALQQGSSKCSEMDLHTNNTLSEVGCDTKVI